MCVEPERRGWSRAPLEWSGLFDFLDRFYEPTSLPIRLRGQVRAVCTRRGVRRAAASAGFEPASSSIACGTCPAERSGGSSWSRTTFYRFSVGRYHSTSSRPENVAPSEGAADFRWIKDPLRYRCATRRGEGSRLVDGAGFEPATVFACGAPSSGTTWHPRSESNRHPPGENRRSWPLDDEGTKRVRSARDGRTRGNRTLSPSFGGSAGHHDSAFYVSLRDGAPGTGTARTARAAPPTGVEPVRTGLGDRRLSVRPRGRRGEVRGSHPSRLGHGQPSSLDEKPHQERGRSRADGARTVRSSEETARWSVTSRLPYRLAILRRRRSWSRTSVSLRVGSLRACGPEPLSGIEPEPLAYEASARPSS